MVNDGHLAISRAYENGTVFFSFPGFLPSHSAKPNHSARFVYVEWRNDSRTRISEKIPSEKIIFFFLNKETEMS